jgi:hypothetical protein
MRQGARGDSDGERLFVLEGLSLLFAELHITGMPEHACYIYYEPEHFWKGD